MSRMADLLDKTVREPESLTPDEAAVALPLMRGIISQLEAKRPLCAEPFGVPFPPPRGGYRH